MERLEIVADIRTGRQEVRLGDAWASLYDVPMHYLGHRDGVQAFLCEVLDVVGRFVGVLSQGHPPRRGLVGWVADAVG